MPYEGQQSTNIGFCYLIAAAITFAIGSRPFETLTTFGLDLENDQIRLSEKSWFRTIEKFYTLNLIKKLEVICYRNDGARCYRILFVFSDGRREDLMKLWSSFPSTSEEECQHIAKEIADFLGLPLKLRSEDD